MRQSALQLVATVSTWTALAVWAAGCVSARAVNPGLAVWIEGPARWWMLPEEVRALKSTSTNAQALIEIEAFWRRRDPTPEDPENPFRAAFFERSVAADRLYAEGNRRGSLTDRGRALVLLGPPKVLRYRQRTVPSLERKPARLGQATGQVTEEIWGYAPAELPPALVERLEPLEQVEGFALVFVTEGRSTYLADGEGFLELAVAAAVAGTD